MLFFYQDFQNFQAKFQYKIARILVNLRLFDLQQKKKEEKALNAYTASMEKALE